jgi:hypothetical protein
MANSYWPIKWIGNGAKRVSTLFCLLAIICIGPSLGVQVALATCSPEDLKEQIELDLHGENKAEILGTDSNPNELHHLYPHAINWIRSTTDPARLTVEVKEPQQDDALTGQVRMRGTISPGETQPASISVDLSQEVGTWVHPERLAGGLEFETRSSGTARKFSLVLNVATADPHAGTATYRGEFEAPPGAGPVAVPWEDFKLVQGNPSTHAPTLSKSPFSIRELAIGPSTKASPGKFDLTIDGNIYQFRDFKKEIHGDLLKLEDSSFLKKISNNLHDPKNERAALEICAQGKDAVETELKRLGLATHDVRGFVSPPQFYELIAQGKLPIETGPFALAHGAYSHVAQVFAVTRGMGPEDIKRFAAFYRSMGATGPDLGWPAWDGLFDAPGLRRKNAPWYWRDRMRGMAIERHASEQ